jgi:uncharacterized repeat protein (TIGR03803 family)
VISYDIVSGVETVLHTFTGPDGSGPIGGLINIAGKLYGVTYSGGTFGISGTIFQIDPATGIETVLHSFDPTKKEPIQPKSGLLHIGNFVYGTSFTGGATNFGALYKFNLTTKKVTVLHSFKGGSDGIGPEGGVINVNGTLYGATSVGGGNSSGTLYKYNLSTGVETVLHSFGGLGDGFTPGGANLLNVGGVLYGTTTQGGSAGIGTIYKYDTSTGTYSLVSSFVGGGSGAGPYGGLIARGGFLYGATDAAGAANVGVVYRLTP